MKNLDNILILNALKEHYKFDKGSDFAEFLGIKPAVLSNWYARNTIDWDLIFTKCVDVDLNLLIRGASTVPVSNEPPPGSCKLCEEKDKVIAAQQAQIDTQSDYIELLKAQSPCESGQKRKAG